MSAKPIIAALGDSLTVGEHADGAPLHNHPWPELLDVLLFPATGVGQFGLGGDTIAGMQTRYNSFVKKAGAFKYLILWGGVNDIIADTLGSTVWTAMQTLVDGAIADGLSVVLVLTPGFGSYSGWTNSRQTQLNNLRTLMLAKTGVKLVDLYQPYPTGLNNPLVLNALSPLVAFSDGLHINPDGAVHIADIMQAAFATVIPAITPSLTISVTIAQMVATQAAVAQLFVDVIATRSVVPPTLIASDALLAKLEGISGVQRVDLVLPVSQQVNLTLSQVQALAAAVVYNEV
jgi:lysophospholipase L1-like esterase